MRVAGSFGMTLTRRDKVLSLPGKGGNQKKLKVMEDPKAGFTGEHSSTQSLY